MTTTTKQYEWQARKQLVQHLRSTLVGGGVDSVKLEERLTDLARSGSYLASEAKQAIVSTSERQWRRLLTDVRA